jgi:hypothetical protein
MDIAANAAISTGKEALNILNDWLDDVEIAKSWYGESHRKFAGVSIWPPRKAFRLQIKNIFTIKKDDWQQVIEHCLSDCYKWHRHTGSGECCWLRIFMSLPENLRAGCLQKPESSLQSLSIVQSLPAARIDLWGLVVFAFANGAEQSVRQGSTGSFCAKLSAINFVLTIWQYDMAGPICAHLEPREQGSRDRTMLTSPEWNNLLWSGHTFKESDHILGWPLTGELPREAPSDLTGNVLNEELSQIVMDNQWYQRLQQQLRKLIYECHDIWEKFDESMREERSNLMKHSGKIQQNLLAFKLLLVDDSASPEDIIGEETAADTLHYAQKQLALVEAEIQRSEGRLCKMLHNEILPLQKKIVALIRLMTLPKRVIPHLSTRDTGIHVSLA